ncbi:hypothetical protein MKX01_031492 [Papaver californicum]|nr:hypothetical protein MKX01_031492 [Papaver californicum]
MICFDDYARDDMCAATCGHLFCNLCWTQYVSINISDGPGCLMLRYPDSSCSVAIGQELVNELVSDKDKVKYSRYLYRSYVEDKRKISKWCPGPGCEFAIEFVMGSSSYDVVCGCGHGRCWNCVDDAHRPVDCETVHKWALNNTAESENVTWILANSKSCPKCKRPIQKKNEGCMHMTCRCRFEFCWRYLGDWKTHGNPTSGFYACNVYETARAQGIYGVEEMKHKSTGYVSIGLHGKFDELFPVANNLVHAKTKLGNLIRLKDYSQYKEYDMIVSIISCFQQCSISQPMKTLVSGLMAHYPARHKYSKMMFMHFAGLLLFSFEAGIEFLSKGCIFMLMTLMNLFIFEEGNMDTMRRWS